MRCRLQSVVRYTAMKPFNSLDFWGRLLVGFVVLQFFAGCTLIWLVGRFVNVEAVAPLAFHIVAVVVWSGSFYFSFVWAKRTAKAV